MVAGSADLMRGTDMSILRIRAAFVYVEDMKAARQFYEGVVGLPAPAVDTPKWVQYDLDVSAFALHLATQRAPAGAGRGAVICLEVDDLGQRIERLHSHGATITMPPREEHGYQLAEFEDPDGNRLRLIQLQ